MTNVGNEKGRDSSHEFNLYVDRQLQNKLLQVEEDSDVESYEIKLAKQANNVKTGNKSSKYEPKPEDITGWFPSAKFVPRRTDGANISRPETNKTSNFIHPWKDYRTKKEDSFVFKHYAEYRNYIEQYRNDHGCQNNRFTSGNQYGDTRRIAFQTATTQQQNSATLQQQQQQQLWPSSAPSSNQTGLHYTNRKEHLGTLVTPNGNSPNCTCGNKQNLVDSSSQYHQPHNHRYKLSAGSFARTNTAVDLRPQLESDNSSESGDITRLRPTSRRSNSATSVRSRNVIKSPTKITVPANPNARTYPIQALTIAWRLQRQQNGKADVCPSPKPLDNLNCVAPEKQPAGVDRRNVEQLELALRVHSLNDLLTANDAPLRGYALPKSMPPHPNTHNALGSEASDSSDDDSGDEDDDDLDSSDDDEVISLDQLSTCHVNANINKARRKMDIRSSQTLHTFLKQEPLLSSLNQKPEIKKNCPSCTKNLENGRNTTPKMFNGDAFMIPQNDVDAMLRVNMWNPILSSMPIKKDLNGQKYRSLMNQEPFRRGLADLGKPAPIQNDLIKTHCPGEAVDFFNPVKKIRMSITRLDNAVSFCRTQVQNATANGRRESKGGHSAGSRRSKEDNSDVSKSDNYDQYAVKLKPPIHDPFVDKLIKPTRFEQKILPLPHVKILETVQLTDKDTGSLSAKRLPSAKSKKVEFDLLGKSSHDGSVKSFTSNKNVNLTVGTQEVSFDLPINTNNELKKPKANGVKNDTTTHKEKDICSSSSGKTPSDKTAKDSKTKEKGETLKEDAKDAIKTLQGVKIGVDSKKQGSENGGVTPRELNSRQKEKVAKKTPVASGKHLRSCPELEGLTWAEKLEVLRSVNKPLERPKAKPQKLKYIKDDGFDRTFIWATEHEQLYEQRRIRHIVEQARLKGGKKLDWVYEAQVRARGIDWGTGKLKTDEAPSGECCEEGAGDAQGENEQYGICVTHKGSSPATLFNSHGIDRSKTYISP